MIVSRYSYLSTQTTCDRIKVRRVSLRNLMIGELPKGYAEGPDEEVLAETVYNEVETITLRDVTVLESCKPDLWLAGNRYNITSATKSQKPNHYEEIKAIRYL